MKKILLASALLLNVSFADWFVETQDDIFTGKKNAILIGDFYPSDQALAFECQGKDLIISYLEPYQEKVSPVLFKMLFKIDDNQIYEFEGELSNRNNKYVQVSSYMYDKEKFKHLLNELLNAKTKMVIGVKASNASGFQQSLTANVRGSTKAVREFGKICGIAVTNEELAKEKRDEEEREKNDTREKVVIDVKGYQDW